MGPTLKDQIDALVHLMAIEIVLNWMDTWVLENAERDPDQAANMVAAARQIVQDALDGIKN